MELLAGAVSGRFTTKRELGVKTASPVFQGTQFSPTSTRLNTSNKPEAAWPWPYSCSKEASPLASSRSGLRVPEAPGVTPSLSTP